MNVKYIPIVTLRFRHDYFADGRFNGVKAALSDRTLTLLKNYNLAWKQFGSEIVIAYDELDPLNYLRIPELLAENGLIEVFLYTDHQYFSNFTDLPLTDPESNIFYFSNTGEMKEGNLAREGAVSKADRFRLVQEVFQIDSEKDTRKIELLDIFSAPVKDAVTALDKTVAKIDLRNEGNGLYTIGAGKEKDSFYFDKTFGWSKPVAVIELWLGKNVPAANRPIQNNGSVKPVVFDVAFKARAVYWKYYVMSQYLREMPSLGIANGKSEIKFNGPLTELLLEKHEAQVFISDKAIPLSDNRRYKFQLNKNHGGSAKPGKAVVSMLPQPGS